MWKSKTNNGFSLIETVCSVFLFTVLFFAAITIDLTSIKIKASGKEMKDMMDLLEIVKNSLQYNASYEDICRLKTNSKLFINNTNMCYITLKDKDVVSLFESRLELTGIRIEASIEGDKVFKIILNLKNDNLYRIKPLTLEFYKGNYQ